MRDIIDFFILLLRELGSFIYYIFELLGYYNDFMVESILIVFVDFYTVYIKFLFYFLGVHLFIYSCYFLTAFFIYSIPEPEVDMSKHVDILIDNFDNPNQLVQTRGHFWLIVFFLIIYEFFNFLVLYKVTCLCLRFDPEDVIIFVSNNKS